MAGASAPRVVVVGGGVLGVSTAAALARRGAHVTLVTDGPLAGGASGRSLSWLNSVGPHPEDYHRLRLLGLDRYRALAAEVDAAAWLRFDGALTWAAPGEADAHRRTLRHLQGLGYRARWLTPQEVGRHVPGVDVGVVPAEGALHTPDEGWVDLPRLVGHLAERLVDDGGRIRTGDGPAEPVVTGGRVTGVRTAAGEVLGADVAVLATGAAVPATVARFGFTIPDGTSVGLLVRTAPVRTPLRVVLSTPRVSVRPAPGGALVLDAAWSEREVEARPDGTYRVPDSTVPGLLREASAVLGGPTLTAESVGVGAKPVPGDGRPVLGPVPGVAGLRVAFTHSGATLGLVVGELLADEVVDGRPAAALEPFRPARFA